MNYWSEYLVHDIQLHYVLHAATGGNQVFRFHWNLITHKEKVAVGIVRFTCSGNFLHLLLCLFFAYGLSLWTQLLQLPGFPWSPSLWEMLNMRKVSINSKQWTAASSKQSWNKKCWQVHREGCVSSQNKDFHSWTQNRSIRNQSGSSQVESLSVVFPLIVGTFSLVTSHSYFPPPLLSLAFMKGAGKRIYMKA